LTFVEIGLPRRRRKWQAIAKGVHIVGVSSLAAGHLTLTPDCAPRSRNGGGNIMIVVGGVIPQRTCR
jgi:methylmalonyl-CoA mutase